MKPPSQLPPRPDFETIEAAARDAGATAARGDVFTLIGQLSFSWSNNESLLVYFIMLLLGCDREAALIVFGTLNTSRARVDLVQRLARVKLTDRALSGEIKRLMTRFDTGTRLRNDLLHAMFTVDAAGHITHTHAMRLEERAKGLRFGAAKSMDSERLEAIRGEIRAMNELNRDLWTFLPRLEASLRACPRGRSREDGGA
ncbi:hypothetical protein [Aureimonas sp. AU20]|uniref:hypothetical protein n=1 Tax=Aureimonas sp. AU20 TaxID=1349819 RepID=UPI0007213D8D|nr:hypothetical protein [Aureimonas sp. AU20]ALN74507.1 hypothetical protein M673_17390 [Aureimonas sp. AU20]